MEEFLQKNKLYTSLIIIVALLETVNKIIGLIQNFPTSKISLSIIFILLFVISMRYFQNAEGNKSRKKLFLILKISCYSLLLIPVFCTIIFFHDKKIEEQTCKENRKKLGILIASFSKIKSDETDAFSSNLFGKLNSELQNSDTINVNLVSTFIPENGNYIHLIKETFDNNCIDTGLIVFGNGIGQNSFNCRIYSLNFLNFKDSAFFKTSDKNIIYIQNPNTINFTIEYEASTISKFIYGLIYFRAKNYILSNEYISKALLLNTNEDNNQFIGICHFFRGNNYLKLQRINDAIKEYKKGELADPINENLHYNLAAADALIGKIDTAYDEYVIAHNLNFNLINPLHKINTLTNAPKPDNLSVPHFKFKLIDTLKTVNRIDTAHQNIIKENWNEQCYKVSSDQKYGVINNRKDTIVKCIYDGIESFPYKNADCFIVKLNNKYGAFVHIHYNNGYSIHAFPLEYSERSIKAAIEYCLDNH